MQWGAARSDRGAHTSFRICCRTSLAVYGARNEHLIELIHSTATPHIAGTGIDGDRCRLTSTCRADGHVARAVLDTHAAAGRSSDVQPSEKSSWVTAWPDVAPVHRITLL